MTHPQDVPAPSPTVSDAMREAPSVYKFLIAGDDGHDVLVEGNNWFIHAHEFAAFKAWAASALAALERENATLRAERDDLLGQHVIENDRMHAALSELATLRASAERREAALEQIVALAPDAKPHPCDAPEDLVLWSIAELARAALTPKETPDAS